MPTHLRALLSLYIVALLLSTAASAYADPSILDIVICVPVAILIYLVVKFAQRTPWSWNLLRWIAVVGIVFNAMTFIIADAEYAPSSLEYAAITFEICVTSALLVALTRSGDVRRWFFASPPVAEPGDG